MSSYFIFFPIIGELVQRVADKYIHIQTTTEDKIWLRKNKYIFSYQLPWNCVANGKKQLIVQKTLF